MAYAKVEESTETKKPWWYYAREVGSNIAMAALLLYFCFIFMKNYYHHGKISSLLTSAVQAQLVFFYLTRRFPRAVSFSWFAWLAAFAGSILPLLVRPVAFKGYPIANYILLTSSVLQFIAILSLGKSFGVVAANRGIRTQGFYAWVRHPIYASYFLTYTGVYLANPHWLNAAILVSAVVFQVIRIHIEESLLRQDPEYRSYMKTVRWRIFPYVF